MTDDRRCSTCANWAPLQAMPARGGPRSGECRRHAPRPLVLPAAGPAEGRVVWPITLAGECCGEWFFGGDRLARRGVVDTVRAGDATAAGVEDTEADEVLPAS